MDSEGDIRQRITDFILAYGGEQTLEELKKIIAGNQDRFSEPDGILRTLKAIDYNLLRPSPPKIKSQFIPYNNQVAEFICRAKIINDDEVVFPE